MNLPGQIPRWANVVGWIVGPLVIALGIGYFALYLWLTTLLRT